MPLVGALLVVTTIVGGAIVLLAGWFSMRRIRRFYESRDDLRERLLSDTKVRATPLVRGKVKITVKNAVCNGLTPESTKS